MEQELKFYVIEETGDVLQYIGEVLTDPHKCEYSSEFKVIKGEHFKEGNIYCDYELHSGYNLFTLRELPDKVVKVLYGR
jgi:hypothetical protein